MPTATDADVADLLAGGELVPLGRISDSSNGAILAEVRGGDAELLAIYKPIDAERPLWDYPDGTLAGRERAAYLVSAAGGFGVVPPTVLRDGPAGPGSVQQWIGDPREEPELVVAVTTAREVPEGWRVVLRGETERGERVVVSHADEPAVRSTAVLDALINNSDRKGGHLLRAQAGVRGVDHGVSLGVEPKLRTVLWGWAGEPVPEPDLDRLRIVADLLDTAEAEVLELADLLTRAEIEALRVPRAPAAAHGPASAPLPGLAVDPVAGDVTPRT